MRRLFAEGRLVERHMGARPARSFFAIEQPTSGRPSGRETRYRIADTYLAFWTRFIEPARPLLDRGRSQQVLNDIVGQWPDYRGRAIEPIVRESVARLLPIDGVDAHTVASYWTRDGRTEVGLVGVEGNGSRRRVSFIGSIKWRQRRPFSGTDASALAAQPPLVPGVDDRTKHSRGLVVGVRRARRPHHPWPRRASPGVVNVRMRHVPLPETAGRMGLLVSRTVKDLVVRADIGFTDIGERELEGVPGTWQLYSID